MALLLLEDHNALSVHLNRDFAHVGHSGAPTVLILGLHIEVGQGGGVGADFGQGVGAVAHEVVRHLVKGLVVGVAVDVADAVGVFEAHRFPILHPTVLARRAGGIGALDFASLCGTRALGGAGVVCPELGAHGVVLPVVPATALLAGHAAVVVEQVPAVAHTALHARQAAAIGSHRINTGGRAGCSTGLVVTVGFTCQCCVRKYNDMY